MAQYGVNPKTGNTYLWEDFISRAEFEAEIMGAQVKGVLYGAALSIAFVAFVIFCIQSGHAPIF